MLPKPYRLPGNQIPSVKQQGSLIRGPLFAVLLLSRQDHLHSRFGFIVSPKVSAGAVIRNKLKRRLRQAVFSRLKIFPPGLDIIFLAQKNLLNASYSSLLLNVDSIIVKLNEVSSS